MRLAAVQNDSVARQRPEVRIYLRGQHRELLLAFEDTHAIMVLSLHDVADVAKFDLSRGNDRYIEDLRRLGQPCCVVGQCGEVEEMLLQHFLDIALEEHRRCGVQSRQFGSYRHFL